MVVEVKSLYTLLAITGPFTYATSMRKFQAVV